jgi:SAM-dependent methyltransferase
MMNKINSKFWDQRFSVEEYIYGTAPNKFFKKELDKLSPGKILLLGEGEGRNAVYAAKTGWSVDAVDYSYVAKAKALKLAQKEDVSIKYYVNQIKNYSPKNDYYDVAAIIFLHLNPFERKILHRGIIDALSPNGIAILEVYEKEQLGKSSGGPQNLEMLYSLDEIKSDFSELETVTLKKEIINLTEGNKHTGEASVIRYVGKKKNKAQ